MTASADWEARPITTMLSGDRLPVVVGIVTARVPITVPA